MIELIVLRYLESVLNIPILTEANNKEQEEFITIEKLGGGMENHLYFSTISIQSYSDTKYHAAMLSKKVIEAMGGLVKLDDISKVRLVNDYDFTDTEMKRFRYQAIFEIIHY